MKLRNIRNTDTGCVTWGCMWKKGELKAKDNAELSEKVILKNESGKETAMQSRITAYWPDHSIKWTAHTANVSELGREITVEQGKADKGILKDTGLNIAEDDAKITVESPEIKVIINKKGDGTDFLFDTVSCNGREVWQKAVPVLKIEKHEQTENGEILRYQDYKGKIEKVSIEAGGPVEAVIKFEGTHVSENGEKRFPFVIRMFINGKDAAIKFTHTFMVDVEENTDFLKGIGISFDMTMAGKLYNRHVKFMNEHGMFHEALVHIASWRPRVPRELFELQMEGKEVIPEGDDLKNVNKMMEDIPFWAEYSLCQDSVSHYQIKKKLTGKHLCFIPAVEGIHTKGGAAVGSNNGTTLFAIWDFWEKYPSGYNFTALTEDRAKADVWFWSPEAPAMDFRHYADRGYNQVCYEGYDYKGADPDGIACTNECKIGFKDVLIADDKDVYDFTDSLNAPAVFVSSPEFYHDMKAFGYWSLPKNDTETEKWLEDQLDKAFSFYKNEVSQRNWYGMFNYGDFMHTYDPVRHTWKYDVGGYAWDNTELVPTLWLWLYFMRTGREDVFTVAEKLSRHASEVDVYHFGKYKGLGSRHNVRHWGCPCKEARIAMAGHHRYLYYLTGDYRLEDIFDELKDNELSFLNKDPLGDFFDKKDMVFPSHARSGPDWSSLVSNWMTEWERHDNTKYLDKIKVGLGDIASAPLKLSSGPDFEFDPKTVHLRYIGERTTGGCHLQVCMGAPSIWMETADLMEDENFKKMIADHGRFYFLPREKQLEETKGIIGNRESTLPMLSCAMGAYGAKYLKDEWLSKTTWKILLETMIQGQEKTGYVPKILKDTANCEGLKEIDWVTTNFTAQWCLNTIMTLEFIRDDLPETIEGVKELVEGAEPARLHKS